MTKPPVRNKITKILFWVWFVVVLTMPFLLLSNSMWTWPIIVIAATGSALLMILMQKSYVPEIETEEQYNNALKDLVTLIKTANKMHWVKALFYAVKIDMLAYRIEKYEDKLCGDLSG